MGSSSSPSRFSSSIIDIDDLPLESVSVSSDVIKVINPDAFRKTNDYFLPAFFHWPLLVYKQINIPHVSYVF